MLNTYKVTFSALEEVTIEGFQEAETEEQVREILEPKLKERWTNGYFIQEIVEASEEDKKKLEELRSELKKQIN